jgi:hypothetical protein
LVWILLRYCFWNPKFIKYQPNDNNVFIVYCIHNS